MRWYDRHEKLAKYLDGLKDMDPDIRTHVVRRLLSALRAEHPQLVSADSVLEFPLDFRRRRWYDKDPYLWLVMNGLSNAPHDFLGRGVDDVDELAAFGGSPLAVDIELVANLHRGFHWAVKRKRILADGQG